jgi:GTPase SAR1 family protein
MKARDNPFATDRALKLRYHLHGTTWDELLERLDKLNYRAALVGPEGSGKTTLLEDLAPHLRAQGYNILWLRLDRTCRKFSRQFWNRFFIHLCPTDMILFDGAEQMSRLAWERFKYQSHKAGGMVITSHRAGLLPTLLECSTTPELLGQIITEILGQESDVPCETMRVLYDKHNGNLRSALRELYDMYAAREE